MKSGTPFSLVFVAWLAVNVFGFGLAGILFHNFPLNYSPSPFAFRTLFDPLPAAFGFIGGFITAFPAGWLQQRLLKSTWPVSWWWAVSVSLGVGVMHTLADGYVFAGDGLGFVAAGAIVTGLVQWALLRPHTNVSIFWAIAGTVGWVLGWVAGIGILDAIRYVDDGSGNALGHGLLGAAAALAYAAGTGLVLFGVYAAQRRVQSGSDPAPAQPR